MLGKPIKAFIDQDHEAHIAVHMQFLSDPSLAGNKLAQKTIGPVLIAHIAEHMALLYRVRMQKAMGVELPPLPDIRDPKFKFEDVSPQMDNMIAERAAQVIQQAPKMKPIPGVDKLGGGDPMNYAQQLAKIEAEAVKARTQAEIQADQAKAKSDIQIDQAKAQVDIQKSMQKLKAELEGKMAKLQAEIQIAREKEIIKANKET